MISMLPDLKLNHAGGEFPLDALAHKDDYSYQFYTDSGTEHWLIKIK